MRGHRNRPAQLSGNVGAPAHESLDELLQRLDAAIVAAYEYDHFHDEVNGPQ